MDNEITVELKELRDMVNQSLDHTYKQLQSIESNVSLGVIISIFVALGISFQLKILAYWIPASFLLLVLLLFQGLRILIINIIKITNITNIIKRIKRIKRMCYSEGYQIEKKKLEDRKSVV